jgi:ubiquitin C
MQVFIRSLIGRTITLEVEPDEKIAQIKDRLSGKEGVPIDPWTLDFVYVGKRLEDDRTLADYNITKESTIQVVLVLRGGGSGGGLQIFVKTLTARTITVKYIEASVVFSWK